VIPSRNLKGLRGFLIDAPEPGQFRGVRDGAILVEDGLIAAAGPFDEVRRAPGAEHVRWLHSPEAVLIPGLIDIHAHLPQYPVAARVEEALLPWLQRHIFPIEKEFNAATARQQAPHFFEALARHGTTCAMLHAAIYEESCDAAFEAAERSGMRIILGKVMMDDGSYGDLPRKQILPLSLEQSERLCRKWHGRDGGRIEYAFSPRFAVACSEELMREAGSLARKFDAYIQTHLSENREEIEVVRTRFPQHPSYAAVYEACGLLGDRTVLGHCIHLDEDEISLLVESKAAVAHCPTSNLFLSSGIMPLDRLRDAGLRVGLASDVAGGPELDLWRVMRCTIESQRARSFYNAGVRVPDAAEVFHLATIGGAQALGKESLIGTLDVGKEADIVVLDLARALPYGNRGNMHSDLSAEEVITLLVYRGGPQAVVETFVRGGSIYRAPEPLLL
jgi:guanine deaminase